MHLPCMLANPHYYDYLHFLDFHGDGSVELADGAGQVINTVARGQYQTHDLAHSIAEVAFFDLIEVDPYQEYRKVVTLPSFTVQVTKEEGVFPFIREVVWNVEDAASLPALLYRTRYVYVFDPLAFGRPNQLNNLYYIVERKELVDSTRYYYPRDGSQELTVQDLLESGIPQELFWPSR